MNQLAIVLVALASMAVSIRATCTADSTPCEENSGTCSSAVLLALPPSNDLVGATAELRYGKYCGALNKCVPQEMGVSGDENTCMPEGSDPCPALPCDGSDTACATHDGCLDAIIAVNPPPEGERVPVPERCFCDVQFTASLGAEAAAGTPSGLCDEIFYTVPQQTGLTLIETFQHEAVLLAAPYCCDVLRCEEDAQNNGYEALYQSASQFCSGVLQGIESSLGVDLCASEVYPTEPPTPEPPPDRCTLCSGGEQWDILGLTSQGIPCAALAATAAQLDAPPNPECLALQFQGWTDCGCNNPPDIIPGETCHICGNPSLSFNADKVIWNGQLVLPALLANETTCGQINTIATFTPAAGGDVCLPFEAVGPYCECQGQPPACTVCHGGEPVPEPELPISDVIDVSLLPFDLGEFVDPDRVTCGQLDLAAAFVGDQDTEQCNQLQNFAVACRCSSANPSCTVCPGGEAVPNPSISPADLLNRTALFLDLEFIEPEVLTCGVLDVAAAFVGAEDSEQCRQMQGFATTCECESAAPSCTICPDGAVPDPDISLADIVDLSELFVDLNIVDPELLTCGVLDFAAGFVGDEDTEQCDQLQSFAFACQCPNAQPECTLCPRGEEAPNRDVLVPGLGLNITCAELELVATSFADEFQCIGVQETGVLVCGCQPPEEPGPCGTSICPDGTPIPDPDVLAYINGAFLSCGDLEAALSAFGDPIDCEQVYFIGVQVCGCSGGESPSCPICEDGSALPDPLLDIAGEICSDIAFQGVGLVPEGAACTALQATYGVYCGCEGGNPLGSAGACRICGDGNPLPDPAREVSVLGGPLEDMIGATCGRIEFLASAGEILCNQAQSSYGGECCEADAVTNPPSTLSPSTMVPDSPPPTIAPDPPPPTTEPPAVTEQPVVTRPPSTQPPTEPETQRPLLPTSEGFTIRIGLGTILGSLALLCFI